MKAFLGDERGATAIEYGLIAALIFLAILGAVIATGSGAVHLFDYVAEKANPVLDTAH